MHRLYYIYLTVSKITTYNLFNLFFSEEIFYHSDNTYSEDEARYHQRLDCTRCLSTNVVVDTAANIAT
ncbi:MAG: hypothetical protein ACI90V_012826, partial [Bacillariaceae sp.]